MKRAALVWAVGAVGLLGHFALVYALLAADNVMGAFTVIAFGAMALGGAAGFVTRQPLVAGAMILCAFVGSFVTAFMLDRWRDFEAQLAPSNVVRDVACNAIHEHPPGRLVYLQDCEVRADLDGRAEDPRRRGGHDLARVAPLVPAGWAPPDVVPAWAAFRTEKDILTSYTESEGLAEWAKPNRAGFVLASDKHFEAAVDDAERRHELVAVFAPLVHWIDPEAERVARRNRFALALAATQAAWLLAAAAALLQRKKSATASA